MRRLPEIGRYLHHMTSWAFLIAVYGAVAYVSARGWRNGASLVRRWAATATA